MNHSSVAKQANEIKTRIHHDSERYDETFRVGVEIEACLLDDNSIPVNADPLIKELEGTKHKVDYEYGICQFEYKTLPTPMDSLLDLNTEIEEFIEYLDKSVQKVRHYMLQQLFKAFTFICKLKIQFIQHKCSIIF